MKKIYEEYAVLTAQIKDLQNKKDAIAADILKDMAANGMESQKLPIGKFTVAKVTKWTYPESITEAQDKLDAKKEKMKITGEATSQETDSLRYTPIKF